MSDQGQTLEHYIKKILEGHDKKMVRLSKEYGNRYTSTIKKLNLNRETLSTSIKQISQELFSIIPCVSDPYVESLLLFSVELDSFYKLYHYSWYTTDMLVQTLVHILSKTQFKPPSYNYNICTILY